VGDVQFNCSLRRVRDLDFLSWSSEERELAKTLFIYANHMTSFSVWSEHPQKRVSKSQDREFWRLAQTSSAIPQSLTTMAPRTRGNVEVRKEADDGRPTVADLQGDSPFAQLAKKHWLKATKKSTKVKVKPEVLKKDIWDVLEQEDFSYKSLLVLENLQLLER